MAKSLDFISAGGQFSFIPQQKMAPCRRETAERLLNIEAEEEFLLLCKAAAPPIGGRDSGREFRKVYRRGGEGLGGGGISCCKNFNTTYLFQNHSCKETEG